MNGTAIDEARELIAQLDGPRCEWRTRRSDPECSAPSEWLMRASCGDTAYFCEPHKRRMHAQVLATPIYCERHLELGRVLFDWIKVATP